VPRGDQNNQEQETLPQPGPDRGQAVGDDEQGGRREQVLYR
jgi:hypothetical protein